MKRLSACFALSLFALTATALAQPGAVTPELIDQWQSQLAKKESPVRIVNAVTNNSIKDISLNRALLNNVDKQFNVEVKRSGIIDQRSSGRCWMFAGVNAVAPKVMAKLKLSDFDISQAYLAFYDKIEKSNMFLERMIELVDKPIDDRVVQMYLDSPIGDGGWWHYFADLIDKYGLVPASAMPETKQSSATGQINKLLASKLRQSAARFRTMHEAGKSVKDMRQAKEAIMADIYRLLVYCYGQPPTEFVFRWESEITEPGEGEDKDSTKTKVLMEQTWTPRSFYDEFFGEGMPEYVAICNNPALEYGTLYELEGSRNIQDRADMRVLNADIETLKKYSLKALLDSQIVWFACDVGKDNYNDSGLFAIDIYDYNTTFDMNFKMSKADRINFNDMSPNHAMVLTAVDTANGAARKWQVENSWGKKPGDNGVWTMMDDWFDEWVLLVIVDKALLDADDQLAFTKTPVKVADWEPFFRALENLE